MLEDMGFEFIHPLDFTMSWRKIRQLLIEKLRERLLAANPDGAQAARDVMVSIKHMAKMWSLQALREARA